MSSDDTTPEAEAPWREQFAHELFNAMRSTDKAADERFRRTLTAALESKYGKHTDDERSER